MGAGRTGSILSTVLVVTTVCGLLGMALVDRAIQGARTGAWSRDHLCLRLLAESAAEEMFVQVQAAANTPGLPLFARVRQVPDVELATVDLAGVAAPSLDADIANLQKQLGAPVRLECHAELRKLFATSDNPSVPTDPIERFGLLRLEASVSLRRGRTTVVEKVRTERSFHLARVTPPALLGRYGLFVAGADSSVHPDISGVNPVSARLDNKAFSLNEILTDGAAGFQQRPQEEREELSRAMGLFSPALISTRAQYLTSSTAQMGAFIDSRRKVGAPVNGLIHNRSTDPIRLAFAAFRGKCTISTCGPVEVGDIRLEDPRRDSLTIVSASGILVAGRVCEAYLVNFCNERDGVVFAGPCHIKGGVLCSRWPGRAGLSEDEYENCKIERVAGPGDSADEASQHSAYFASFSPHPVSVEHARDREDWSQW
jgi:hypothetical protein